MPLRLRIVGWAHLVFGAIGLALSAIVVAAAALSNDAAYSDEYAFLLFWAAVLTLVYFLPSVSGGFGLLIQKRSSRSILWLESALLLVAIPIGPILAGFTIWALLTTRDQSWDPAFVGFHWQIRSRLQALALILVALVILAAIIGVGWLFRDMLDPPGVQQLTPLPSGVPPQLPPDIQQPVFRPPDL